MDYSISLALFDFVPVLFTGIALYYVWSMTRDHAPQHRYLALLGGILIVAAGLTKASWKMIIASTGTDVVWLSQLLFPLMAPGFILAMVAVLAIVRGANGQTNPLWLPIIPLVLIGGAFLWADYRIFIAQIERGWFQPLLLLVSVGNAVMIGLLVSASVRRKKWLLAGLFFANIVMTFALQPIAAMDNLSIAMHWLEQSLTAAGAGAFAYAAYGLSRVLAGVEDQAPLILQDDPVLVDITTR
jgi:hypothetical protein